MEIDFGFHPSSVRAQFLATTEPLYKLSMKHEVLPEGEEICVFDSPCFLTESDMLENKTTELMTFDPQVIFVRGFFYRKRTSNSFFVLG